VEAGLDAISKIGNDGKFIADRLVSWKPSFLKTEYTQLLDDKSKGSKIASDILDVVTTFLTIKDAAPTLDIVEPKVKKK